jgi:hypothetical protein
VRPGKPLIQELRPGKPLVQEVRPRKPLIQEVGTGKQLLQGYKANGVRIYRSTYVYFNVKAEKPIKHSKTSLVLYFGLDLSLFVSDPVPFKKC